MSSMIINILELNKHLKLTEATALIRQLKYRNVFSKLVNLLINQQELFLFFFKLVLSNSCNFIRLSLGKMLNSSLKLIQCNYLVFGQNFEVLEYNLLFLKV